MLRLHTLEHIRCSSSVQQQVCLRAQAGRDGGTGRRGRATLKSAQRLVSMPRPMPSSTTKSASLAAAASAYETYNHSPGNGHWPGASHSIAPRQSRGVCLFTGEATQADNCCRRDRALEA